MNCWEYQELIAAAGRRGQPAPEAEAAAEHRARCRACREFAAQVAEVSGPLAEFRALAQGAAPVPSGPAADAARAMLVERLTAARQPPSRPAGSLMAWVSPQSLEWVRRVVCEYPAATAGFAVLLVAVTGLARWSQDQARWPSPGSTAAPRSGPARTPYGLAAGPAASAPRAAGVGQGEETSRREGASHRVGVGTDPLTPTPTRSLSARPVASSPRRPLARSPRPAASGSDDLTNLNGDLIVEKPRWGAVPGDEWMAVEAGLDRLAPRGDDFVQIPFPRLASTSNRQLVAAVEGYRKGERPQIPFPRLPSAPDRFVVAALEQYKREAGIVDPRLARAVTVQQKGAALSELCEGLRSDTGIQLVAGRSVADEKVTLFCQKQPLREVMRQLSRPFGYTWLRSGKTGEYKYELTQDLRSQLLEEELRSKDRNAALIALDREMSQYRPFLALTPEQARARLKTATELEKPALEGLAGPGWAAIQMYFKLSPNDMAALRSGEPLRFSTRPGPGEYPLPPEVARGILQSLPPERDREGPPREGGAAPGQRVVLEEDVRVQGEPGAPGPGAETQPEVQLEIQPSELGQFTLMGGSGVTITGPQGSQRRMSRSNLATGESPTVRSPENARFNAKLQRDPALKARVSVRPEASCANPSPGPSPARRGGGRQHLALLNGGWGAVRAAMGRRRRARTCWRRCTERRGCRSWATSTRGFTIRGR